MSFQHGLSGLNAASKQLEVIGNNVANANTVGFKQSQAQFADVYASSISGAGVSQIGIGTKVANVAQQFTQGNITNSSNPLDIAINGNGFFGLASSTGVNYGRNGQFHLDKNGYIVNATGARLQGFMPDANGIFRSGGGSPVDLKVPVTGLNDPKPSSEIYLAVNLTAGAQKPAKTTGFDPTDPQTYNNSTSVTVYDSKGNSHMVQMYFVKEDGPPLGWRVHATNDVDPAQIDDLGLLEFNDDGTLKQAGGVANATTLTIPTIGIAPAAADMDLKIDFKGTTERGAAFAVDNLDQNGYAVGRLAGLNVNSDGIVVGRYTNGRTVQLGQVALYNIPDPNGLQPLGNNVWEATTASGQPTPGEPGTGKLGVLQSQAVEDSNVDLTAELVNMITAQRVYQANTQTIKTQDQVLQSLLNLR